jgi:hypothetical protein
MKDNEINKLVELRTELIKNFNRLRDYKQNKNAIMLELDHVKVIHSTIVKIDKILESHVVFEDRK